MIYGQSRVLPSISPNERLYRVFNIRLLETVTTGFLLYGRTLSYYLCAPCQDGLALTQRKKQISIHEGKDFPQLALLPILLIVLTFTN
jgi:hypothetical protein